MSVAPRPAGLEVETSGRTTVVRVPGENVQLTEERALALHEPLRRLAGERQPGELVLDLHNVSYLTSTTLGLFLTLRRQLEGWGARLALANVRPPVREVLEVTHLDRVFDVRHVPAGPRRAAREAGTLPPPRLSARR